MKKIITGFLTISLVVGTLLFSNNVVRGILKSFSSKVSYSFQNNLVLHHAQSFLTNTLLAQHESHSSHESHASHASHSSGNVG
jgi:K+-transporting ATPase A subunit